MPEPERRRWCLFLILLLPLLAACGGGGTAVVPATVSSSAALPATSASGSTTGTPSSTVAISTSAATATSASASSLSAASTSMSTTVAIPAGTTTAAATAAPAAGMPHLQGALTVFAAASLTEAFKALGALLQQANPGSTVTFNFGGSPTLRAQLAQGGHADVFASADEPNMQGAQKDGSISGNPRIFAQNKLTVIVPAANPAGITKLQDLAKPGVKLDLADPMVPVGNYARQAFAKLAHDPSFGSGFADAVTKNVVSNESDVKQVVAKVQLGEADAGVVYQTDVTASVRSAVKLVAIPDQFNVIAQYPIAVVNGASNADEAQTFITFVLSPTGQAVLAKYGFAPPPTTSTASATSSGTGGPPTAAGAPAGGATGT